LEIGGGELDDGADGFAGVMVREVSILVWVSGEGVDERDIGGENIPTPLRASLISAGNVKNSGSPCRGARPRRRASDDDGWV
jgi:hypothetical protein